MIESRYHREAAMTIALEDEEDLYEPDPIFLERVSWETYIAFLRHLDETSQRKKVIYDRGRMLIVSPLLPKHEKWKSLIGRFVEAIADERGIPISTFGSTTWKSKKLKKGLEPDECFYVQHESQMRHRVTIDLRRDPPPDLCIEINLRRAPIDKLELYAALRVPEVWHCDDDGEIEALALRPRRKYVRSEKSVAFPFLRPGELKRFLDRYFETDQNSLMREVRAWAAKLR